MRQIVRMVLQRHLADFDTFPTAWEGINSNFTAPYQSVWLNTSTSETGSITDKPKAKETGFLQVTLFYPMGNGTRLIEERASELRRHFYGLSVIEDNVQVVVQSPPLVASVQRLDNLLALPITINYSAYEL